LPGDLSQFDEMKNWIRPIGAFIAIAIVVDGLAVAVVALTNLYSDGSGKCFPAGFLHAQWPKWIWCTFAAREGLAAGLLGAAGALIAACIAAYAVWLQLRASLQSREEDRIEKTLPSYTEANQVLSDFIQQIPNWREQKDTNSLAIQIRDAEGYVRRFLVSADEALILNTYNLVKAALNSAMNAVKHPSHDNQITYEQIFSILSRRQQYLQSQIQIMIERRDRYRNRLEGILS
jgi:hypothetical protein